MKRGAGEKLLLGRTRRKNHKAKFCCTWDHQRWTQIHDTRQRMQSTVSIKYFVVAPTWYQVAISCRWFVTLPRIDRTHTGGERKRDRTVVQCGNWKSKNGRCPCSHRHRTVVPRAILRNAPGSCSKFTTTTGGICVGCMSSSHLDFSCGDEIDSTIGQPNQQGNAKLLVARET